MSNPTTRRDFTIQSMGSLLTFSLLETLFAHDAFANEIKPITAKWLKDMNELSRDVKGRKLTQIQWQKKTEELFGKVDLKAFLKLIDYDKFTKDFKFRESGERAFRGYKLPEVEGLPKKLMFGHTIFAVKKGQSIAPHGHYNMTTAFYVLEGEFHGRHYDRVEDDRKFMIVKPTIDQKFGPGSTSTISDFKDNIHWFKGLSKRAFIFNVHVLSIDPKNKKGGRVYIDPDGEKLSKGLIKVPKITYKQAYDKYGVDHHTEQKPTKKK